MPPGLAGCRLAALASQGWVTRSGPGPSGPRVRQDVAEDAESTMSGLSKERRTLGGRRALSLWKRLAFAVFTVGTFVVALEFALRALGFGPVDTGGAGHPGRSADTVTTYHSFLGLTSRTLVDGVWRRTYRGRLHSLEKPRRFRIVCLGGSTTFGAYLEAEEAWPRLLEDTLRREGLDVEVVNAGVAWYTSAHSLVNYVLQMRYFNPDVVVVMHAVNDLYRSFHKPGELPCERDYGSYAGPLHRLVVPQRRVVRDGPAPKRSFPWTCALWQIACRALSVVDPHHDAMLRWTVNSRVELPFTPGVPPPETGEAAGRGASEDSAVDVELEAFRSLPQYEAHLDYLTRLCREDGCDVVLATQASLYTPRNTGWPSPPFAMQNGFFRVSEWQYVSAASLSRAMRAARAVVCRVASRHEVVVADVETALDGRGDAFIDDFHLSVAGNRVAADTVAGVVRGILSRRTEERSGAGSASAPTASPGGGQ